MLVTLNEILRDAKEKKYAVGAFNVPNLEAVMAVVSAAEELNVPVILAHAELHDSYIPMDVIGPIMLDFAKKAKVPVCVHFDHGVSFDKCIQAIRLGFTSIMYDASGKTYEENLAETTEIVRIAHSVGVSVEAELGHIFTSAIGGGEGRGAVDSSSYASLDDCYTNPDLAKEFAEKTGVDALAIAFGTTHGVYLTKPVLDFNRITAVKDKIDMPFVMHGGSGVSDEGYREAISRGIAKINYYTYMSLAGGDAVAAHVRGKKEDEKVFFHDVVLAGMEGMKEDAKRALKVFNNK